MYSPQEIEEAITVLESRREALSEDVANLALRTLQNKLADIQMLSASQQLARVTILVADLSGFTTMSEFMDAEEVRDTVNAVWAKLDNVINAFGGQIDKHVGDAIIALFGVDEPREDDALRAVQAALDMHVELAQVNEKTLEKVTGRLRERHHLQMRIGIHCGPVFIGPVGTSEAHTAVGDNITIANQLEKRAPVGGVLISHEVYKQIHQACEVEAQPPISLGNGLTDVQTYVVIREKPHLFQRTRFGGGFLNLRMVGRAEELEKLQNALRRTLENENVQMIYVVGECGIGKTRLLYEFERVLTLFPERMTVVRATAVDRVGISPYSLLRDMLINLFDIPDRNTERVIRNRLVDEISQHLPGDHDDVIRRTRHICELVGFDFSDWERSGTADLAGDTAVRIDTYDDLAWLFTEKQAQESATILLLDDLQWADEGTLEWLDYFVHSRQELPLLLVAATQPALFARRPFWQPSETFDSVIYQQIDLKPLTSIDSRHLLTEIIQEIPTFPGRLHDQIVNGAKGNPLHLEEIVKLLQFNGVIEKADGHWLVHIEKLAAIEGQLSLGNLLAHHIEQLPPLRRKILQKAAVLGRSFLPSGLAFLSKDDEEKLAQAELLNVLQELEKRDWFYLLRGRHTAENLIYAFPYEAMRQAIIRTIPENERQTYHVLAATWFVTARTPLVTQNAGIVAAHFEEAGQIDEAVSWYGRAAEQAQNHNAPDTAILYSQQALRLLPEEPGTTLQRLQLQDGLGYALCCIGRYEEAAQAFQTVQLLANDLSSAEMLVKALWGLFLTAYFQEAWESALEFAENAEALARDMHLQELRHRAQVGRGLVLVQLGELNTAVSIGKEAYSAGKTLNAESRGYSHFLLGLVGREKGHFQQAAQAYQTARDFFAQADNIMWQTLLLAELGQLALAQQDFDTAVSHFHTCLVYSQDHGYFYTTLHSLRQLGHIALFHREIKTAEGYFQQALALADKANSVRYRAQLAADIGKLHLAMAVAPPETALELVSKEEHMEAAFTWFERALKWARSAQQPLIIVTAVSGLAQLFLEDHLLDEAEAQAILAVNVAEKNMQKQRGRAARRVTAVAWRVLGQVLAKVPQKEKTAVISGQQVDASTCFGRSLQILDDLGEPDLLEKAITLRASALFELHRGHEDRAKSLRRQSIIFFRRLGLDKEALQTKELVTW